jgi:hypothetical protein
MKNVIRDTTTLLALATLADAATRTVRKVGQTLRYKTTLPSVTSTDAQTAAVHDAIWALAQAGRCVRLYEGTVIMTPVLAADGARSWDTRVSRLDRTLSGAVVEVRL